MMTKIQYSKKLTSIRLINWHCFSNETIPVEGTCLFTGQNGTGKSVILDAIVMALTTNTTKFNQAAMEKGKRTLLGYVRWKTGEDGNAYVRDKGPVVSYVALEFYEEKKQQYFVIGVRLESRDIESTPEKKWFIVDGTMDSINFVTNGKPSIGDDFTQYGRKIKMESQVGIQKENIRSRLGHLDDKFTDMLVSSMAFKPMDNVKEFINKFILPEKRIEIENLRQNIRNYHDLQELLDTLKIQIEQLERILKTSDELFEMQEQIIVIDILLQLAELEDAKDSLEKQKLQLQRKTQLKENKKLECGDIKAKRDNVDAMYRELYNACSSNECHQLIIQIENILKLLEQSKSEAERKKQDYDNEIRNISSVSPIIEGTDVVIRLLRSESASSEEKIDSLNRFNKVLEEKKDNFYEEKVKAQEDLKTAINRKSQVEDIVKQLNNNIINYPANSIGLRNAINEAFKDRGIQSEARILADLLEVTEQPWQNAIEGYLNSQRFYIVVEPKFYDIAAEAYDKIKSKISGVGLINLQRIPEIANIQDNSLARKVSCTSSLAQKYINYVLGTVECCKSVGELKAYDSAITKECMLYKNHVLRKINPSIYEQPYIGRYALEIQRKKANEELQSLKESIQHHQDFINQAGKNIEIAKKCNPLRLNSLVGVPAELARISKEIKTRIQELTEARNNPNYLELQIKLEEKRKEKEQLDNLLGEKQGEIGKLDSECDEMKRLMRDSTLRIDELQKQVNESEKTHSAATLDAREKYAENVKKKDAKTIRENYQPRRRRYETFYERYKSELIQYQTEYRGCELGTGVENLKAYQDEYTKLVSAELIKYEDKLRSAKNDCEVEFKENFLAKMRDNIAEAEAKISNLNKALSGVKYGSDTYKFILEGNKDKISLYNMIKSEINMDGLNLFTEQFEDKYHEEMEDLFAKLTDLSLDEKKVLDEYTDYRSYLDYDIDVRNVDTGKTHKVSKTYGEKSGGETQTPYYVAIAASFYQMYSISDTVRIIIFDEAFNNMDDARIESMMKFLTEEMQFQMIVAAPESKMEVLGEHVDSKFMCINTGKSRIIERYYGRL